MSVTLEEIHASVGRYLEQHPDEGGPPRLAVARLDAPTQKLAAKLANG